MSVTAEDVERTARDTNIALWGVASVVMAGSMVAGGFAFHHLNQSWWSAAVGVVTALAVDLALAQWLRIGRRIRAAGADVFWGRVLEFATAGMTLYLNVGAAMFIGVGPETAKRLLAVAHAFLPVVLVLVSLAGGEAQLKLQRIRRDTEAAERAERKAQLAADRAVYDAEQRRQDQIRQDNIRTAELGDAQHQREIADQREERERRTRELVASMASVLAVGASLRRPPGRPRRAPGPVPRRPGASMTPLPKRRETQLGSTAQVRQAWIEAQLTAGHDVTGADVKARFPDASNGARDVATVKTRMAQETTLRRASVHAVKGDQ